MDERKKEDLSVQDVEVVPVKKKRKKISISMILCVVFLITTGIFWSNSEENSKSYAAVQKQYDKLKSEQDSLSKEVSYYKEQYEAIEQQLDEQNSEIDNLKDENSDLKKRVNTLKSEKKKLKTENASLKTEAEEASSSSDESGRGGGRRPGYHSYSDDSSDSQGTLVWLSETGSKYHSIPDCGRMNPDKAWQVSESEAEAEGYGRCSKCF